MAKVLVICPTFDHSDTLFASIGSVRAQSFTEWEMAVILDGAPPRTSVVMNAITKLDDRIQVYEHPKSERYGELYRDPVIRDSSAEFVCHIGDDDLYLPGHLSNLVEQLAQAEWVNQAPLRLVGDRRTWVPTNYGTGLMREAVADRKGKDISMGLNYVAYRRDAYLRQPQGWTCAPWEAGASDLFMWSKFFRDKNLTVASSAETSALKIPSRVGVRQNLSSEDRLAEMMPWLARAAEPGLAQHLRRRATVFDRLFVLFFLHGGGKDLADAFSRAGLAPASETVPPVSAIQGGPMVLPLTQEQLREAAEAWLIHQAYVQRDASARGRVAKELAERPAMWMRGASLLASQRLDVEAALDACAHFQQLHPKNPQGIRVAISSLVHAGRHEEAARELRKLAARWPDDSMVAEGISMPADRDGSC